MLGELAVLTPSPPVPLDLDLLQRAAEVTSLSESCGERFQPCAHAIQKAAIERNSAVR
jgi:hypothetical protein